MILYRIYTEDVNQEKIKQWISDEQLDGFTVLTGIGYWRGRPEDCLIVEVIGGECDRDGVLRAASRIKVRNKQDSVVVTEQKIAKTWTIGETLKSKARVTTMKYTDYRNKAFRLLWRKYNLDHIAGLHGFNAGRLRNICANHWRDGSRIILCVTELEAYLVNDLLVERNTR